jgi:hypothetical protein
VIAFAAYSIYRQNQLTFISLSERQRGLLLGALGVVRGGTLEIEPADYFAQRRSSPLHDPCDV